ncbi:MAG: hypothetical protein R3349_02770 [Geminicoccaceae bacterium]|nr:hypothetical protein [Geminicoccaceae bacterium]
MFRINFRVGSAMATIRVAGSSSLIILPSTCVYEENGPVELTTAAVFGAGAVVAAIRLRSTVASRPAGRDVDCYLGIVLLIGLVHSQMKSVSANQSSVLLHPCSWARRSTACTI